MGCTEEGRDTAKERTKQHIGENGSGSFEVSLRQRSHPVISLGCGPGVLPLVIYHPLKC